MSTRPLPLRVEVRAARLARGWSQAELARRAGISRAEVSAVENGRAAPSTAVALSLARALGSTVEALFALGEEGALPPSWAWEPPRAAGLRYWVAEAFGRPLRFPVESGGSGEAHDGVEGEGRAGSAAGGAAGLPLPLSAATPSTTLVMAGCDPAVGLLRERLRAQGVRLLTYARGSRRALELVAQRRVHVAGVHLGSSLEENLRLAERLAGRGLRLLHLARWSEGVAVGPGLGLRRAAAAATAPLRWVGREEGSGARACLDLLLQGRPRPEGWEHTATDHRAVVETIRTGWAQAGISLRIAAEEGGLDFLPVRTAAYDLCFPSELEDDPRGTALLDAVRSAAFRRVLADLPGYDARETGALA